MSFEIGFGQQTASFMHVRSAKVLQKARRRRGLFLSNPIFGLNLAQSFSSASALDSIRKKFHLKHGLGNLANNFRKADFN